MGVLVANFSLVFTTPGLSILKKFAMAMASSLPQARDETAPFGFDQAKIFSQSRQCAPRDIDPNLQ